MIWCDDGVVLLFVRHAMPAATETVPPEEWALTPLGHRAARRLRARFPDGSHLAASSERKAWETVGGPEADVERDSRFDEVSRAGELWGGEFLTLRRRYVGGARHPGWEPQEDAAVRFDAAVVALQERHGDRPIVIGTHGMVLTNWLVSMGALSCSDAAGFWADLRYPDCIEVDRGHALWRRYC